MGVQLENILSKLQNVTQNGERQFMARCPSHKDDRASLSVSESLDGVVLVKCFAGCEFKDIIAALGIEAKELFPPKQKTSKPKSGKKIVATYDYLDETGSLLFQKLRYEPKDFRIRRPDGAGNWKWGLGNCRRVLCHLPKLIQAVKNSEIVFIVEGEKDADNVEKLGLTATTNFDGAGKWNKEYNKSLSGAKVVILPDNDGPGQKHAQLVAKSLSRIASSTKILNLPDLPEKGDVSDWIEAGGTREQLLSFVEDCNEWEPPPSSSKKESAWPYEPNEDGLARFFAAENHSRLRFCHQLGKWLVFDGKKLGADEDGQIIEIAKETIRKIYAIAANIKDDEERESLIGFALRSGKKHVIKAMLELAQSDPLLVVNFKNLDANDFELNTPSGVVDLITQTLRPAKITDLNTKITEAPWIPGKKDPKWEQFLIDALPDEATRACYKRSMGYCLSGSNEEERVFMNIGPPGSGKGTAQAAIMAAMGDYAGSTPFETFLLKESGGVGNDIAGLLGYRIVFASEANEGKRLNEALINTLSGRDRISVRFLFREFFQAVVKFKIWLSANSPPRIQGDKVTSGIWRRLVRFGFKYPVAEDKRDPKLKSYFENSLDARAAVLNWLIEGFEEWRQNGLGISEEVRQDTEAYADDQDPLKPFFEDCCVINSLARVSPNGLYQEYRDWCGENGIRYIMNQRTFSQRLINSGFAQGKSGRSRFWKGIGLLTSKESIENIEKFHGRYGKVVDLPQAAGEEPY